MCAQSKWRGSLLMEWLIVFGISLIILPIIAQTIRTTYQTIRNYIIQINEAIERNERYYTLYKDAQSINTHLNDCCFQTSTHTICYEIINQRFRRKKSNFSDILLLSLHGCICLF